MNRGERVERGKLQDHRPAQRTCLGPCGKVFWSQGPGNRVCKRCRAKTPVSAVRVMRLLLD